MIESLPVDQENSRFASLFRSQVNKSIEFRTEPIKNRKKRLKSLLNWIYANQQPIRDALMEDLQKPPEETDLSETYVAISEIKHALSQLNDWVRPSVQDTPLAMLGTKARVIYEPKGVVLIISPWNFPFNLSLGPVISAIAAGNTVILKPSEFTPATSALMDRMAKEVFSEDEVTVVQGGIEESQELLKLPFNHIFFTGSPAVGKIIMRAASDHLTSVTLELGGKSPVIVDETADIADTCSKIVTGKFLNSGQTCVAPDYVMVHESIQKKFMSQLVAEIEHVYGKGKEVRESPFYSRMVSSRHTERFVGMIENAVSDGAVLETGGEIDVDTCYIQPTVLSNVSMDSSIMKEEIFGPVLPVFTYSNLEKTLDLINSGEKPLALYVFTKKKSLADRVLKSTSSGTACVNECVAQFLHLNLPFGGINNSGFGKSHGYYGFLAFSNEKGTLIQRRGLTTNKLVSPPYTNFSRFVLKILLKYL